MIDQLAGIQSPRSTQGTTLSSQLNDMFHGETAVFQRPPSAAGITEDRPPGRYVRPFRRDSSSTGWNGPAHRTMPAITFLNRF